MNIISTALHFFENPSLEIGYWTLFLAIILSLALDTSFQCVAVFLSPECYVTANQLSSRVGEVFSTERRLSRLSFIHLVVCLTTGPKPLPKRALHSVRSTASFFKW